MSDGDANARGGVPAGRSGGWRPSLPDADLLAVLVTNVTDATLGLTFEVDRAAHAVGRTYGRSALVRILRPRPLSLLLASDERGARSLGAALFACVPEQVEDHRVDDALKELANMMAGQIELAMRLEGTLRVPRRGSSEETSVHGGHERKRVVLRSGSIELALVLWDSSERVWG